MYYYPLCFARETYITFIIFVTAKESSHLSRLGADVGQPQKVYCVLIFHALEMEPDC